VKLSTVLVTGGAGFIGSHVCESLVARGARVRVLDDLSMGRRDNVPAGAELMVGDVRDPLAVVRAMSGVEAVFHLAARVSIRTSTTQFLEDASVNVMGTLEILRAAAAAGVRKVLYASSMAVYGEAESVPQDEDHPLHPLSPYGVGKVAAEKYCLVVGRHAGFQSLVLRYFNTFGTRQTLTPYVGVMTIFIHRLLSGSKPVIFGDGEQTRDFVYVGDVAEATVRAMESDVSGTVLNVGTGRGTTVNRLARLLCERIDPSIQPEHAGEQPGETRISVADNRRLESLVGFVPLRTVEDKALEVIESIQRVRRSGA